MTVRDAIEQAIYLSVGTASLTRERADAVVGEFVRKGQIPADEGRAMVDRLMSRVKGEGADGLVGKVEGGLQQIAREVGLVTKPEIEDLTLRLAELEHRITLLERAPTRPAPPGAAPAA